MTRRKSSDEIEFLNNDTTFDAKDGENRCGDCTHCHYERYYPVIMGLCKQSKIDVPVRILRKACAGFERYQPLK